MRFPRSFLKFIHVGATGSYGEHRPSAAVSGVPLLSRFLKVRCCFPWLYPLCSCNSVLKLEFPTLNTFLLEIPRKVSIFPAGSC